MKKEIEFPGHVLLSFFDIEYESSFEEIAVMLMNYPNKIFKLSLESVPKKKEKK